jgi:hypothetical protein
MGVQVSHTSQRFMFNQNTETMMKNEEIFHKVDEWAKKNYPDTIYLPHEIAIAKRAYQAGLTEKKEMRNGQAV